MDIIWGSRAVSSYKKIRNQIRKRFSEKEESAFIEQVFETIQAIEQFPEAFPETKLKRIKSTRKAVIHPHSTLFYRLESTKRIRLLFFWDNRDNAEKLK